MCILWLSEPPSFLGHYARKDSITKEGTWNPKLTFLLLTRNILYHDHMLPHLHNHVSTVAHLLWITIFFFFGNCSLQNLQLLHISIKDIVSSSCVL